MAPETSNYDAIRDMLEKSFRPLDAKARRQLERIKDHVDNIPQDRFVAILEELNEMDDGERREWVTQF